MASKTQTKTEIRNNTAKIGKLLRGIDNETFAIKKDHSKLNERIKAVQESARSVQTLIGGISNMALTVPAKAAKKSDMKVSAKKPAPAKKLEAKKPTVKVAKKPAPAKKPAVKVAAKKPAPAKKLAAAKKPVAAKKVEAKEPKAAKKTEKAMPVSNRPPLKKVIFDIISKSGEAMGAADIYKEACQKFGYYSRQSLYNALKDNKSFTKNGEKYGVVGSQTTSTRPSVSDSEAEDFVRKVDEDTATSSMS
jgi:hypothetical protein